MARFRIVYTEASQKGPEEVEADVYYNRGEYLQFLSEMKIISEMPTDDIEQIEQL